MNSESANKFISALVKALQTLCHGYVEFNDGIEIIGHIYLNIDSGSSFDYVVKEKLCKNAENSTVFVSKSFQAQAPPDECLSRKERDDDQAAAFEDSSMSPSGTARLQSAITSISNVLSGAQEIHKSRLLDHASHSAPQNTGKRKREHNGSYSNMQPPLKYTTLHTSSTSSSYFSSVPLSKQAADRNNSEHFSSASHAEFFGGDSNQSSGMGQDDEDDLHLDVTFVKEEYESQRNSSQRGVSLNAASRLSQDLSSNQSNMLHDGTPRGGTLGYSSSHHQLPQQFASGTAGDMGSLNQGFQDSSQVDVDQHTGQRPPNPRSNSSPNLRHLDSGVQVSQTGSQAPHRQKLEYMTSISDTLQLGIRLFGPSFVAEVASRDLTLPSMSSDLGNENSADVSKPADATVFPHMFDLTVVSGTSIKPGHNILWRDRKDKMRKSYRYMTRKVNLTKFRNPIYEETAAEDGTVSQPFVVDKSVKRLAQDNGLRDSLSVSNRRKRCRPSKKLTVLNGSEDMSDESQEMGEQNDEMHKSLCQNALKKEGFVDKINSINVQLLPKCIAPVQSVSRNGSFCRRMRGSYRQYTAADKLQIIDFSKKYGSTAASRKYNIPESTVRSWTKKSDTFLMQMNLCDATSEKQTQVKHNSSVSCASDPLSLADGHKENITVKCCNGVQPQNLT